MLRWKKAGSLKQASASGPKRLSPISFDVAPQHLQSGCLLNNQLSVALRNANVNCVAGNSVVEPDTFAPVTVIHGTEDGPVLATVAGVYGGPLSTVFELALDVAGQQIEKMYSPIDGCAIYGKRGPSIRIGDAVMTIGIPTDAF